MQSLLSDPFIQNIVCIRIYYNPKEDVQNDE